jgi:hypothetical protein
MAHDDLIIDLTREPIFNESPDRTVSGGGTRFVPAIPVGNDGTIMPCIWRSRYLIQATLSDGSHVPAYECLLLVSRNPILTMRAEIAVAAWPNFTEKVPVEW